MLLELFNEASENMLPFKRAPVPRFDGWIVSLEAVGSVPNGIEIWISDRDRKKVVPIIGVALPAEKFFEICANL